MKLIDSWRDIKDPLICLLFEAEEGPDLTSQTILVEFHRYLSKNWMEIFSSLSSPALALFLRSFSKGPLDVETLFQSFEKSLVLESVRELQDKGLGILRANIKHLKVSQKFHLYDEVKDFCSQGQKVQSFESYQDSLKKIDFTTESAVFSGIPSDLFQFFFSYGFYAPQEFLEQHFESQTIEAWRQEGVISNTFLISDSTDLNQTQGYLCSHLVIPYRLEMDRRFQLTRAESLQTQVFNNIAQLVFQIQKEGIKITKKGEMNRKNFDKLKKTIPDENLLWFLLQFLKTHGYLESFRGDLYKVSEHFFTFFHSSLMTTYQKLLTTDPFIDRVFKIVREKTTSNLTLADILQRYICSYIDQLPEYFEKRELRRKILQNVELLYRVGLVDRFFTQEGMAVYRLSELYLNAKNHHVLPEGILTISKSFQIVVDIFGKKVSPQILYILSIFGDFESSFPNCVFQINQQTFHRALYFGFKTQEFVDVLVLYGKIPPDEFLMQTILHWEKTYKTGFMYEGIILHTTAKILDELEHKPEYATFIKKRLSSEYALVTEDLKVRKILEDSSIFFFSSPNVIKEP